MIWQLFECSFRMNNIKYVLSESLIENNEDYVPLIYDDGTHNMALAQLDKDLEEIWWIDYGGFIFVQVLEGK